MNIMEFFGWLIMSVMFAVCVGLLTGIIEINIRRVR
jgi:hypothetical protein